LKNPSQKRAGGLAQGVDPEFRPQYHQERKKKQLPESRDNPQNGRKSSLAIQ
jgi:hypothetical protein